ncbi:hypothetical protein [Azospirillum sp. SYSU D00513]|uniref:hypothetical protein n=1 Tax=Azospirillum sp. SYSU D00513 TaxID=2812561 RepID=UPI001A964BA3|nr:hypothetical protein [Azospirillum sp. SYSU D00513]
MSRPHQSLRTAMQCMWTLENEFGHLNSTLTGRPIDAKGRPIPWYTYPAIEYIENLDFSSCSILEWGCGNSTLFWAPRAKEVLSIESDETWATEIKKQAPNNSQIFVRHSEEEYIKNPFDGKKYNLIVIDGKYRSSCANSALEFLESGGLIILDNSDRSPKTAKKLREFGLLQVDMSGFGPINYYTWTTSFFFSGKFRIPRKNPDLPPAPIGGLKENDD